MKELGRCTGPRNDLRPLLQLSALTCSKLRLNSESTGLIAFAERKDFAPTHSMARNHTERFFFLSLLPLSPLLKLIGR